MNKHNCQKHTLILSLLWVIVPCCLLSQNIPHIFQDDNGKLYMYTTRFTDVNIIWVRPMKDSITFNGHPVWQLSSLPNTWEATDSLVAESPQVIKYRNRYYMMYSANNKATEGGNYHLGVAEANSPTTFNNGSKYPYPLILSNQTLIHQPNIVRGPNGFEWWLADTTNNNNEPNSQYIDRIYFHNKTMHAGVATAEDIDGYLPQPAQPSASRIEAFALPPGKEWLVEGNNPPATTYLIEANIKTNTNAGVIAWWKDKTNWIKISLDNHIRKWSVIQCINNQININSYPLYADFKAGVYHKIAIERNGRNFAVRIDGLRAPGMPLIQTTIDSAGLPGIFSGTDDASFAGIVYTNGWDEFDNNITSWGNALSGTPTQGNYTTDGRNGIRNFNLDFQIFKGDLLPKYEFTVQITNQSGSGKTGAYPVYIDEKNYIKTLFNFDTKMLSVISVRKGRILSFEEYPLEDWKEHYADIKYSDSKQKGYTFNTPTWINGIDNISDELIAEYYANEAWNLLETNFTQPVKVEALRFTNKKQEDKLHHIYKIRVNEVFKQSYNLRCVKLNEKLFVFVDSELIATVNAWEAPAQVGLCSENAISTFNGIMRFHIP